MPERTSQHKVERDCYQSCPDQKLTGTKYTVVYSFTNFYEARWRASNLSGRHKDTIPQTADHV